MICFFLLPNMARASPHLRTKGDVAGKEADLEEPEGAPRPMQNATRPPTSPFRWRCGTPACSWDHPFGHSVDFAQDPADACTTSHLRSGGPLVEPLRTSLQGQRAVQPSAAASGDARMAGVHDLANAATERNIERDDIDMNMARRRQGGRQRRSSMRCRRRGAGTRREDIDHPEQLEQEVEMCERESTSMKRPAPNTRHRLEAALEELWHGPKRHRTEGRRRRTHRTRPDVDSSDEDDPWMGLK